MIPQIKGIHLEATNICTLKCPGCARTRFIDQWPQHWQNHSINAQALMAFLDIDLDGLDFSIAGNYGDPIYHPNLAGLVRDIKQRRAVITITTNGSYRTRRWWKELTHQLDDIDTVVFSIDGIPDNFAKYRINADWPSIHEAISICVDSGVKTVWKFIPFAFNQSDIKVAETLCRDLGMDDFRLDLSSRFDDKTMIYMPVDDLVSGLKKAQDDWKQGRKGALDPKCHQGKEHFISADGFYAPCCFAADHRFLYKTVFGKQKTKFDIRRQTLSQLYARSEVIEFYSDLETTRPQVCTYSCPKRIDQ